MLLGDGEHENASVEILPDIMPVELHQTTVSQIVRFLDRRWHLHAEVQHCRAARRQRESCEPWQREARKARVDIEKKRSKRGVDIA